MRRNDVDTQGTGRTVRDKAKGERTIPLTQYVANLLATLPRRNEWVSSSASAANGVLTIPRNHQVRACAVTGLEELTLHGLRRSFKSLTEWLDVPAGVVAQLMGHQPSATAEKHYTVRPLVLLRRHHQRLEPVSALKLSSRREHCASFPSVDVDVPRAGLALSLEPAGACGWCG